MLHESPMAPGGATPAPEKGAVRGMVKVFGMQRGRDSLVLRARALVGPEWS
jgi:hypothetical protein